MNRESQRVAETKERIKEAFLDLYQHKKIEQISIKEITEKAKLNRATFYVYYKDIYDLLEKIENEFMEGLIDKIKDVAEKVLRDGSTFPVLLPLEFCQKNHKTLRTLLGNTGDPNFIHKIKQLVKKNIRELLQKENVPMIPKLEYILEYVASAQIGIITFWLNREMELTVEEIGDLMKEVNLHGPIGYILSHKK